MDTEDSYPYEGEMEDCTFSSSDVGEKLSNFGHVTPGDEEAMRAAIYRYVSMRITTPAKLISYSFHVTLCPVLFFMKRRHDLPFSHGSSLDADIVAVVILFNSNFKQVFKKLTN